jgi:hypothetical protein
VDIRSPLPSNTDPASKVNNNPGRKTKKQKQTKQPLSSTTFRDVVEISVAMLHEHAIVALVTRAPSRADARNDDS